jgi:glycosyltransferase involved in cell wall biosynthesis
MPVHAGGQWLRETLASVAPQADGVEVILLDSSEDDACERIAASFAGNLDLRYQRRPDLKGWPAKTNAAIAAARAPYVAMLHQDDLWLAGRAATLKRMIEAVPDAALLLFPTHIIDADGRSLGVWRCPLPSGRNLSSAEFAERLLVQNFISVPAPVIRRDAWLAAGGMDEALWYTGDWDVYLKLARQGPVRYEPVCTTAFRIHPTSLTVSGSRDRADFVAQMDQVIERHSGLLRAARRQQVLRCARASINVNDALAAAARGERAALRQAAVALVNLTPGEMYRYLRDSRLGERLWPRLRAKLAGRF